MRIKCRSPLGALLLLLVMSAAAGCGSDRVAPVEEEQILNTVETFYVRQAGDVPEYDATLEEVEGDWARVSIAPAGVQTDQPDIFYLQRQPDLASEALETTPAAVATPGQAEPNPGVTETGWVIMAGPQASFTDDELDAAGVPEEIRP